MALDKDDLAVVAAVIKQIPLFVDIPLSGIDNYIDIKELAGHTNKNYRLSIAGFQYVLRIPRQQTNNNINRVNESYNHKIAEKLGLAPKVLWRQIDVDIDKNKEIEIEGSPTGASLVEYLSHTQTFSCKDQRQASKLAQLAKKIRVLQKSEEPFEGLFDVSEIKQSLTYYYNLCTPEQQIQLADDYQQAHRILTTFLITTLTTTLTTTAINSRDLVPSHVDLVLENILFEDNADADKKNKDREKNQDNKIWLIDWEYSAMASPFWDIATVCHAAKLSDQQAREFLMMVIDDCVDKDCDLLSDYREIVKALSACWHAAFT